MTEPDVALTDYGLALECAVFVFLLYRRSTSRRPLRTWFALFFGSIGVAALAGGTVHGFFLDVRTSGHAVLWPSALLAMGGAALSAWAIGARIQFSPERARLITMVAVMEFAGYCAFVLFVMPSFSIAIGHYLPAVVFLVIVFALAYRRTRVRPVLFAVLGLLLTLLASGLQQGRVVVHPTYFDHNALYHLIEAVALYLIFSGAGWFVAVPNPGEE